ncbi:MAG: hypothetical protein LBJ72_05215 [Dysgonamonadaceae bacterium]|jgi:alkyl hydroperoxide reductase subunit F|nr:hypothetical protein [Dysgonamonadaceae bacterium]
MPDQSLKDQLTGIFSSLKAKYTLEITVSSPRESKDEMVHLLNQPGIYAAGDVTTVPYKQIIIAMGEGTKAALSAFEDRIRT